MEEEEINYVFSLFDPDSQNRISVQDVRAAIQGVGGSKGMDLLERLPHDGTLSMDEFQAIVSQKEKIGDMQRIFSLFDADQKGYISLEDLQRIADDLGESMTDEELQDMLDRADPDQDGRVTAEDFSKLMTKKLFTRE